MSGEVRWAGHVASMGEVMNAYNILVRKRERKRLLVGADISGRMVLKRILRKWGV
jgi:hypothetical protein